MDNVAIARRLIEGVVKDHPEGLVSWLENFWEPGGDHYPVAKFPESRRLHGVEEQARFFADFMGAYDEVACNIVDIYEAGQDRVLVQQLLTGVGKTSGIRLDSDIFHCFWLRNGRIFRQEDHLTVAGALHAFGIEDGTLQAAGFTKAPAG